MREIRRLDPSHIDAYADIAFNAYPSFKDFSKEGMTEYKEEVRYIMDNDPIVSFWGMFEEEQLIAVMRLFDFQMNCFGKMIPVSGLGFLGVHLMHKKKRVAKEMVDFYEAHYRERKMPIGLLLPFRPDFYKKMGYGLGSKMNQYRIPASRIPAYQNGGSIRYVLENELESLLLCHQRVAEKTHGMILKFGDEIRPLFGDPFNRIIAHYNDEGHMTGYMVYKFQNGKPGNYTINHVYIKELIYENQIALRGLLDFLKKQEDQVNLVLFNTEDEHFYHLFDDPRNDSLNYISYGYLETNTQAIGAMYKLFDCQEAFKQCAYRNYNDVDLKVRFMISDNFKGDLLEDFIIRFENGKAYQEENDYDVTVQIKLAEFSVLFLGVTSVYGLHQLDLLHLDRDEYLMKLDRLFYTPQKPVCYTDF